MNTLVALIKQNVELEKKAYSEFVKEMTSAGIQAGVQAGLPFEKAASLVETACKESEELELRAINFQLLEKAAETIEALELKVAGLEKAAGVIEHRTANKEPLNKLAQLGFTEEEIEAMEQVNSGLLNKVANASSAPVEMGTRVGPAIEKMDPLLHFLLS